MTTLTMPTPYKRALTFTKASGDLAALPTEYDAFLAALMVRAKLERVARARMSYKMRLNATLCADSRKGKLWN